MRKEVYVAGLLDRIPELPTPQILLFDDTRRLLPFRFVIMTRLAGTRLDLCEREMSEQQLFAAWVEVAAHLRRIHDTPMPAFGYLIEDQLIHRSETNRGYMDDMWQAKMLDFRAHNENDALADVIDKKWRSSADLLDGFGSPRLCHNDFYPGNLLALQVNGVWRISGLFDFEHAFAGDPLMDIAKCVHFAKVGDEVRWRGMLKGYGPIARPDWAGDRRTLHLVYRCGVLGLALVPWATAERARRAARRHSPHRRGDLARDRDRSIAFFRVAGLRPVWQGWTAA